MAKSYKLKDNNYIDSSGITHNRENLKDIINNGLLRESKGDLNNATETGIYWFNPEVNNIPQSAPYGNILTIVAPGNKFEQGSWWIIQIAFTTYNSILIRNSTNGTTWTSWTQV